MSKDERDDQRPVINVQPGAHPAMATLVSRADRAWIDEVRGRSIQLAYARGRIIRA